MSFSYPKASVGVTSGNKFYRIRGETIDVAGSGFADVAPGDLIPINVGFHGIAVGPDSDYENYELLYTDPLAPGELQSVMFSKDVPFIGGIPSDNSSNYGGLTVPKLAFVRIADRNTLSILPLSGDPYLADASVDLIIYTGSPPSHPNVGRVAKIREGNVALVGGPGADFTRFLIPGYGRSYFHTSISAQAVDVAKLAGVSVSGLRLHLPRYSSTVTTPELSGKALTTVIATTFLLNASIPVGFSDAVSYTHNANIDGYFDFYLVGITATEEILPSSFTGGKGVHVFMEVRD